MALAPGTRGYMRAIVAAQMLAQIGAFALPALLPDYIARWHLSKTEAGWLVGIFFATWPFTRPRRFSTRPAFVHGAEMAESRGGASVV
jgi:hypothetical protein